MNGHRVNVEDEAQKGVCFIGVRASRASRPFRHESYVRDAFFSVNQIRERNSLCGPQLRVVTLPLLRMFSCSRRAFHLRNRP